MSGSRFGSMFRVTTFGESHGPAIGLVIEGVRPGMEFDVEAIQRELDRRRPGQSELVTQRSEADRVEVISGVFEGRSSGTPICLLIRNKDQRPRDYRSLAKVLRPGHASFSWLKKYAVFDYRGGGRASGRETAARVAAGAVARQMLTRRGVQIVGFTRSIGPIEAQNIDLAEIERNAVRSPDRKAAEAMTALILDTRAAGDSLGGVVELRVRGLRPGLGEPVFHKLEADLSAALMSIGAVKGVEIGSGFRAAVMKGSEHNDSYTSDPNDGSPRTRSNNAGGVLGGLSNGEELVLRIAVKPPSSIRLPQETIDQQGNPVTLETGGRHDPCICPRVVPVAEAMVALVLVDHYLLQERLEEQGAAALLREHIDTIDTQMLLLMKQRALLRERLAAEDLSTSSESAAERRRQLGESISELKLSGREAEIALRLLQSDPGDSFNTADKET